jgi:hypothetical protein
VARFNIGDIFVGMMLEKLLPVGGAAQAAQHAELTIMEIGNSGAVVFSGRLRIAKENVGEEFAGEFGIELKAIRHGFFRKNLKRPSKH